jgi:hypothetical protein
MREKNCLPLRREIRGGGERRGKFVYNFAKLKNFLDTHTNLIFLNMQSGP